MTNNPQFQTQIIEFLKQTPIFSPLKDEVLRRIAAHLQIKYFARDDIIFSEGDVGDSIYLVLEGSVRVYKEDKGRVEVLGDYGRGAIIGELALLTGEPRAASVASIRHSILLQLTRDDFNNSIQNYPQQLLAITKYSMLRLLDKRKSEFTPARTYMISPAGSEKNHAQFARKFTETLAQYGDALYLDNAEFNRLYKQEQGHNADENKEDKTEIIHFLGILEAKYPFIVYVSDVSLTNWTRQCFSQADRIILVSQAHENVTHNAIESEIFNNKKQFIPKCDLVLVQLGEVQVPFHTEEWLKGRMLASHHHVQSVKDFNGIELYIKFLLGKTYGLVLSGGVARGIAQLGVYRAIQELKIPMYCLGGTSIGSIIACAVARFRDWQTAKVVLDEYVTKNAKKLFDYTVPLVSFLAGKYWAKLLMTGFGESLMVEDLWFPTFIVSSNLTQRRLEVIDHGVLWRAIRSSIALPGIVPPVTLDNGDMLVDGCVMNNLPVDVMRKRVNGGKIIAVDVVRPSHMVGQIPSAEGLSGWPLLLDKLVQNRKRAMPNIAEIIVESILLCSKAHSQEMTNQTDYLLSIDSDQFGSFDFSAADGLIQLGYERALKFFSELNLKR